MRLIYLPAFAVAMGLSAPAVAGSDSSELPNPFTDQPAASANATSTDKGIADPAQSPAILLAPTGDFGAQLGAGGSAAVPSDNSFYQATKKDADSR